jgi:hypothetical protein
MLLICQAGSKGRGRQKMLKGEVTELKALELIPIRILQLQYVWTDTADICCLISITFL